jgi:hypothetical protein
VFRSLNVPAAQAAQAVPPALALPAGHAAQSVARLLPAALA